MKRWNQRCLAGLVAALLIFLMTGTAFAAGNAAAESRNGVVRVVVPFEVDLYDSNTGSYVGSLSGYSSGSAFGVGTAGKETDAFVTNRHVVTKEDGLTQIEGTVYYAQYTITGYYILLDDYAYNTESFSLDTSRAVPCTVVYVGEGEDADVAILRAAEPISGRVALPLLDDESALEVGDTVNALGFPGSSDDATSEGYLLATVEDVTVTNGVVSRFFDSVSVTGNSPIPGHLIQSTASINGGNSGGPLIDENGAVVGINTYTYHGGSDTITNAYYALRIRYAKDALDSLGIEYDVYAPGSNTPLIVAAVVIAVLVVAVMAVLVTRRKKAARQAPSSAAQPGPGPEPAVPAAAPANIPDPSSAQNDSGYRIQGVSGALEGKRYRIGKKGPVILGRDPEQCGVVFPANTPGVSGRHCAVWYENNCVYLKDLSSSHGTFLAPGRRLAAEQAVQLRPGEVFFLGSQEQSFVIAERRPN